MAIDYYGFTFVIPKDSFPKSYREASEYFDPSSSAFVRCSRVQWMQSAFEKLVESENFPTLRYLAKEYLVLEEVEIVDAVNKISALLQRLEDDPIRIAPAFDLKASSITEDRDFICNNVKVGLSSELTLPDCDDDSEGYESYITLLRFLRAHLLCLELAKKSNSKIAYTWPT